MHVSQGRISSAVNDSDCIVQDNLYEFHLACREAGRKTVAIVSFEITKLLTSWMAKDVGIIRRIQGTFLSIRCSRCKLSDGLACRQLCRIFELGVILLFGVLAM